MSQVLTEDETLLRDSARGFISENSPIQSVRALFDPGNSDGFSRKLWSEIVEMGWTGIVIPEEFGGLGFGHRGIGLVMEEMGRTLTASPLLSTAVIGANAILRGGNDAQKANLLPGIIDGSRIISLAVDEGPHHNPGAISMTAEHTAEGYVLNGRKVFVIDGNVANEFIVAARTGGEPGSLAGVSLFIVSSDLDGISTSRMSMVDGRNSALVEFSNVVVKEDSLLGEAHEGGAILDAVLDIGRIALAAEMLGASQQAFEMTIEYLKERKQFGQAIGGFQALQHRAAIMFTELELARSVILEALTVIDDEPSRLRELASAAKVVANDVFHLVSSEGIQMHGGIGMTDEHNIGLFIKRARIAEKTFGGTAFHKARFAAARGF